MGGPLTDFAEKAARALANWAGESWLRHYIVLAGIDLVILLGVALVCLGGWQLLAPTAWRLF